MKENINENMSEKCENCSKYYHVVLENKKRANNENSQNGGQVRKREKKNLKRKNPSTLNF